MKAQIFLSNVEADENYKKILDRHLIAGGLTAWSTSAIRPGEVEEIEREKALNRADIAILLVSKDFLASEYMLATEIPNILHRRKSHGLRVIPILIGACDYDSVDWLAEIKFWENGESPISAKPPHEADRSFAQLTQYLRTLLPAPSKTKPKDEPGSIAMPIVLDGGPNYLIFANGTAYLNTILNDWFAFDIQNARVEKLSPIPVMSCTTRDAQGNIYLGTYSGSIVSLDGAEVFDHLWDAPLLSLATLNGNIVVGDTLGKVRFLHADATNLVHLPPLDIAISEPVMQILEIQNWGLAILGIGGQVWLSEWPAEEQSLTKISTDEFGPIYEMQALQKRNHILMIGDKHLGLLDFRKALIRKNIRSLNERIHKVLQVPTIDHELVVLTDAGRIWNVSADLQTCRSISNPATNLVGMDIAKGWIVSYSAAGNVYLTPTRTCEGIKKLAEQDITHIAATAVGLLLLKQSTAQEHSLIVKPL